MGDKVRAILKSLSDQDRDITKAEARVVQEWMDSRFGKYFAQPHDAADLYTEDEEE